MNDHRGDFQVAVNKALGKDQKLDWEKIRVICIAPEYKKYDLHAARMIGANIELWQFKLYTNGALHLEDVYRKGTNLSEQLFPEEAGDKNPNMVSAGKKAALTRATGVYTFEEHIEGLAVTFIYRLHKPSRVRTEKGCINCPALREQFSLIPLR
jgi:hypothetical protein